MPRVTEMTMKKAIKYGCYICRDYELKKCKGNKPCRYKDILDEFNSYEAYDKAEQKNQLKQGESVWQNMLMRIS